MQNSISFEGTVKESKVIVKKTKNESDKLIEIPVTRVIIELENYDPRIGSFVGHESVSVTIEG